MERVHVAFSCSAAGSLKLALRTLGRGDRVLYLDDDLSLGPLTADGVTRAAWWERAVGDEWLPADHIDGQWASITEAASQAELVVWMSRRCASEYCAFLELCSRVDALHVVDVADFQLRWRDGNVSPMMSASFGRVLDTEIVAQDLFARAVPVSVERLAQVRTEHARLRDEAGDVRVLTREGVLSAPIDHFDATIRSFVSSEWRTCARVVGSTIHKLGDGELQQTSHDTFLFERLLCLVDAGVVEGKNEQELWEMHESWVRLPSDS